MKTEYEITIKYSGEIKGIVKAESVSEAVEMLRKQKEPDEWPDFVFVDDVSSKIVAAMPNYLAEPPSGNDGEAQPKEPNE